MADDPFYIWYERSGGFTGMSIQIELDSDSLDTEEADQIRQLLQNADLFKEETGNLDTKKMPDGFNYKLTVEWGEKKKTVEFSESAITEKLHPLINYLNRKARQQKK